MQTIRFFHNFAFSPSQMPTLEVIICEHTHLFKMNNNLLLQFTYTHPAFLYLGCFYNKYVQTRYIQSMILLMYNNIIYDLDIPSEFPQHSELNGFFCVRNASVHRKKTICVPVKYNYQNLVFKLVTVLAISISYFSHFILTLYYN